MIVKIPSKKPSREPLAEKLDEMWTGMTKIESVLDGERREMSREIRKRSEAGVANEQTTITDKTGYSGESGNQ